MPVRSNASRHAPRRCSPRRSTRRCGGASAAPQPAFEEFIWEHRGDEAGALAAARLDAREEATRLLEAACSTHSTPCSDDPARGLEPGTGSSLIASFRTRYRRKCREPFPPVANGAGRDEERSMKIQTLIVVEQQRSRFSPRRRRRRQQACHVGTAGHVTAHRRQAQERHGQQDSKPAPLRTVPYIYIPGPTSPCAALAVDPNECQDNGTNCTDEQACDYWGENCGAFLVRTAGILPPRLPPRPAPLRLPARPARAHHRPEQSEPHGGQEQGTVFAHHSLPARHASAARGLLPPPWGRPSRPCPNARAHAVTPSSTGHSRRAPCPRSAVAGASATRRDPALVVGDPENLARVVDEARREAEQEIAVRDDVLAAEELPRG